MQRTGWTDDWDRVVQARKQSCTCSDTILNTEEELDIVVPSVCTCFFLVITSLKQVIIIFLNAADLKFPVI